MGHSQRKLPIWLMQTPWAQMPGISLHSSMSAQSNSAAAQSSERSGGGGGGGVPSLPMGLPVWMSMMKPGAWLPHSTRYSAETGSRSLAAAVVWAV